MLNFYYGILALLKSTAIELHVLIHFRFIWGFVIGLFIATLIFSYFLTSYPKDLLAIIASRNISNSYEKLHKKEINGMYNNQSFVSFYESIIKLRFIFFLSFVIFIFFVTLAMWIS